MAYPEDLLQLALEMANLHPDEANRASLRRGVSTGYYALFHLLVSEAVANCTDPQFQATLARVFDHGPMKQASGRKLSELNDFVDRRPPEGPERTIKYHLYTIAETFSQAKQDRNEADYNLLREWQPTIPHFLCSPQLSGAAPSALLLRFNRVRGNHP